MNAEGEIVPAGGRSESSGTASTGGATSTGSRSETPEDLREARRQRRQQEAADRRRREEAARRASEQVRKARKQDRLQQVEQAAVSAAEQASAAPFERRMVAPDARRAPLTTVQAERFDPDHPWVTALVVAWIPFTDQDGEPMGAEAGLDGKARPCVVVAASETHLLVRAGYSQGGVKSRDWRAVPLAHWRRAGLDQPTWVDVDLVEVEREEGMAPVGWLSVLDWNTLW